MASTEPKLRELFSKALECQTAEDRAAFLDQACQGDPQLRAQLDELLEAHREAGSFLQEPSACLGATADAPSGQGRPGTVIGPYKLVELIGEGGMGTVWMAQQTEPVKRLVAVKLIKAGMDSRQVIARFEAERQALALMDHANIARVLDGGTTSAGRPYFVMDLVKGVPITRYCDEHHLTPRQRLELFLPVCHAIQHAHHKGIIHRDLKPSNVLVALYDGRPAPKVIDFGVAKAVAQPLTEKTLVTGFGAIIGTLEYMSPEQAEVNQLDIDTRSDVYALGVLLYELLTGSPPFTKKELETAGLLETLRMIREQEPRKPSTKLSTAEGLPTLAANRGTEPAKLAKLVRGELDWIVMKSLEKDRSRRYETATSLAMDVQRYLADEPVLACPPSASYRLRKFVWRHKGPALAAGLVALTLMGGIVGTTLGLIEAHCQRDAAQAAVEAEKEAKETAQAREAETQAVLEFVESRVFAAARPGGQEGGLGRDVSLRQAIAAALPVLEMSFPAKPLIEARLRLTVGWSLWYLGEVKSAAEQFQTARTLYTQHRPPAHPDTLRTMYGLAVMYSDQGRYDDAFRLHEQTLSLRKATLGPDHPDTLWSMTGLAASYYFLGRYADALRLHEETLALRKAVLGPDHPDTVWSMTGVAWGYAALGRHPEALKVRDEVLRLRKAALGPDHPDTLLSMYELANSYAALGRHADALKLHEGSLALRKVVLGPDHPDTVRSMQDVADSLIKLGRSAEAVLIIDQCVTLAVGKPAPPRLILDVMHQRLRHFAQAGDAAGCRATAVMWDKLNRADAEGLYTAARFRAVTAAALRANGKREDAAAEADRAMASLKQAIAAGYRGAAQIAKDPDLGALRDREDFKRLVAELEAKRE